MRSTPSVALRIVSIAIYSEVEPTALPEPHIDVSEPFAAVPPFPRRPHRRFDQSCPLGVEFWKKPHLDIFEPLAAVPPFPRRPHRRLDQSCALGQSPGKNLISTSSGPSPLSRHSRVVRIADSIKAVPLGTEFWKITHLEVPDVDDAVRPVLRCPPR
ncbi:hypothetical protein B0H11DRAFT_2331765 [Mycena galericulata]|nr:hypothetical protein B0H11DRAFT_2331765 [Mycena galericulata]